MHSLCKENRVRLLNTFQIRYEKCNLLKVNISKAYWPYRLSKAVNYSVCVSLVLQLWLCCVSLWRFWVSQAVPLDCKDETGSLTHCTSISQEKLLDRVIQHAELIYRVSEESCTLFVSEPSLSINQSLLTFTVNSTAYQMIYYSI